MKLNKRTANFPKAKEYPKIKIGRLGMHNNSDPENSDSDAED